MLLKDSDQKSRAAKDNRSLTRVDRLPKINYSELKKPRLDDFVPKTPTLHWTRANAGIIRNTQMNQIIDGSLAINRFMTKPVSIATELARLPLLSTPAQRILTPIIRDNSDYTSVRSARGSAKQMHREHDLYQSICLPLPRVPQNTSHGRRKPKRHRHKTRHESNRCRHRRPTPEVKPAIQLEDSVDLDDNLSYSNLDLALLDEGSLESRRGTLAVSVPLPAIETTEAIEEVHAADETAVTYVESNIPTAEFEAVTVEDNSPKSDAADVASLDCKPPPVEAAVVDEDPADSPKSTNPFNILFFHHVLFPTYIPPDITVEAVDTPEPEPQLVEPQSEERDSKPVPPSNVAATSALPPQTRHNAIDLDLALLPGKIPVPSEVNPIVFRWKYAIHSAFRRIRLRKLPSMQTKLIDFSSFMPDEDMHKYRKIHIDRLTNTIDVVRKTLDPAIASESGQLKLEEALKRTFPYFRSLKTNVRQSIAASCRVEVHPRGRKLVKEGGRSTTVYFMLFGLALEHQALSDPSTQKTQQALALIKAGDCFGETLGNAVPYRSSSVTLLTRSTFVCIEKEDWLRAMKKGNEEASKIENLATLPLFARVPSKNLEALSSASEYRAVAETVIHEPFQEPNMVYVVTKGKVSVTLHIPFVKSVKETVAHLIAPHEYQVVPFYGQPFKEKDQLVHATHPHLELDVGDVFPPIFLRDVRGTYKSYTVTALEATECLSFSIATLQSFPADVIDKIKAREERLYCSDAHVRELQEHYLSTKGWRNDSESVTAQMLLNEVERERQDRISERFHKKAM
ncbi:hypothetical protein HDU91_003089 [Kappamyces sp. JEL0680]|nr:hypothetical protein HDU91_003089 [Kappamyces sp. JEL0680]